MVTVYLRPIPCYFFTLAFIYSRNQRIFNGASYTGGFLRCKLVLRENNVVSQHHLSSNHIIDLTNLCYFQILEGRAFKLQFPWVGVVNRSQADINKNTDMIAARRREREYFANTPEYKHLAHRMGSEHLGKMLSKVKNLTLPFYWFSQILHTVVGDCLGYG